jgi:hypothetical protein
MASRRGVSLLMSAIYKALVAHGMARLSTRHEPMWPSGTEEG